MPAQEYDRDMPRSELRPIRNDPLHDLQLLRDVDAISERTVRALGLLPVGGLPVQAGRSPRLPRPAVSPESLPPQTFSTTVGTTPDQFVSPEFPNEFH